MNKIRVGWCSSKNNQALDLFLMPWWKERLCSFSLSGALLRRLPQPCLDCQFQPPSHWARIMPCWFKNPVGGSNWSLISWFNTAGSSGACKKENACWSLLWSRVSGEGRWGRGEGCFCLNLLKLRVHLNHRVKCMFETEGSLDNNAKTLIL